MTKETIIKMVEKVNMVTVKSLMNKLNKENEFENNLYEKLESIKKKIKKDEISVKYDYVCFNKKKDKHYGRLMPQDKNCLCSIDSDIRSYLARDNYQYIDLSCCHSGIILDLANHYELNTSDISYYYNNREKVLEENKVNKKYINEICNNEICFDSTPPFAKNIHHMIYSKNGLCSRLKGDVYFRDLWETRSSLEDKNQNGKFLSMVCQTLEASIVERAISFYRDRNMEPNSYIFDGLLYKKEYDLEIEKLNKYIKGIYKDFLLNPIFKYEEFEISKQYQAIFNRESNDNQSIVSGESNDSENKLDLTDNEVAEYMFNEYNNKIIKNNEVLYAYYKNEWTPEIDCIFEQWLSLSKINISGNPKKPQVFVKDVTSRWPHFIKQIKCICIDRLESGDILNKQKDILPFKDGYYNFATCVFTKYSDEDVVFFTYKVRRNFPTNNSKVDEVKTIISDIFNNDEKLMDEVLSCLVRGLANHIEDKVGLCMVGERCSAKGFIMKCLMTSFTGVVGTVISKDLASKKASFESAERANGFLKTFCENLLCISEEVSTSITLDGALWKTIASGGDTVKYRTAYGKLSENPIRALYVITTNDTPKFDLIDARENMLLCSMPCKYYETIPEDNFERGFVKKQADPNIKVKFASEDYKDSFTLFLFQYFKIAKPSYTLLAESNTEDTEVLETYVDPKDGLQKCILRSFEITSNNRDRVNCSELNKIIIKDFKTTTAQIKSFLCSKGVLSSVYREGRMYSGIKYKVEPYPFI